MTRVTFLYLKTLEILFEENFLNKKISFIVGQYFGSIFCCGNKYQQNKINVEKLGLLLLVVATKLFYRFFLYHHVGAHLKIFWRVRGNTSKKFVNIQIFFYVLPRAHAKKNSVARQHDDKEKICKNFFCYDQKQQQPIF